MGRRLGVAIAFVVIAVALSGCFNPHRVQVAGSTLDASPMEWNVTKGAIHGSTFGQKTTETRYVHAPEDGGPPYPGVLQVFSIRGGDLRGQKALLDFTNKVIDEAIEREGISIDGSKDAQGERELRNGEDTGWFSHQGIIRRSSPDSIFLPGGEQDLVVRVLGEAGYDGKSKTAFVIVAFVQIGQRQPSNVPGVIPDSETLDERTWFEVVGDSEGSVNGASLPAGRGLIYNLRTHG